MWLQGFKKPLTADAAFKGFLLSHHPTGVRGKTTETINYQKKLSADWLSIK